jgi:hypothetical protein
MSREIKKLPSQKVLRELFTYDPGTGILAWRISTGRGRAGQEAGWLHVSGYVYVGVVDTSYKAHRLIWKYVHGTDPKGLIDHTDRNKTNNRICNLRVVSEGQNNQNKRTYRNNLSGHKGVGWYPRRNAWRVRIQHDGRVRLVGFYADLPTAIAARNAAEQQFHIQAKN